MTDVYCDVSECIYHFEGKCKRTSIAFQKGLLQRSEAACVSMEIRKALDSLQTDKGHK